MRYYGNAAQSQFERHFSLLSSYRIKALLAACKPLILLDFHRSFNDTRTNRSILWGTPIFYFLNCSVIVVRKRATFCLFSPTYKKRDFYRFFMIARPKGKSSRDFPFCFVKFHTEHLVCVRFDGKRMFCLRCGDMPSFHRYVGWFPGKIICRSVCDMVY